MVTQDRLLKIKDGIDKAKTKIAELNGKLESYMEQLEKQHNCTSLDEAAVKLGEYDKDIESLKSKIEKATKELREKYGFD